MINVILFVIVWSFIFIVLLPTIKRKNIEKRKLLCIQFDKTIKESIEETELIKSKKTPTDEHINLYYKMYLKKWHLKHNDKWFTNKVKPMSFNEWEERAKSKNSNFSTGYIFIISETMDVFIGIPVTNMYRYIDYRKMVEEDERK